MNVDNKFLIKKELEERKILEGSDEFGYLYPNLNDPKFNIKIAEKWRFTIKKIKNLKNCNII